METKPNVAVDAPKITETFGMGKAPAPKVNVVVPKFTKVELRSEKKAGAVAEKPKKHGGAS